MLLQYRFISIVWCVTAAFSTMVCDGQVRPISPRPPIQIFAVTGAAADGVTDDTQSLQNAINGLAAGATLDLGDATKTYLISRSLILKPNATYTGGATIRMSQSAPPGTQIAILQYQMADNVSVIGLTLDANGVGGGISIAINGGGTVPAQNITIRQVTFRNTNPHPQGGGDEAIYDPVGVSHAMIANNVFLNCGGGILISDPSDIRITQNEFDNILRDDAIYLLFPANPFPYGTGIVVSGNRGHSITRIAIEMWGPGGASVQSPLISNNVFQGWSNQSYGISIMVGSHSQILSNTLLDGSGPFGIEVGSPSSTVQGNTVNGFSTGIVLHDAHDSLIDSNVLTGQADSGILLSNAEGSRANLRITGNQIQDSRLKGIAAQDTNWTNALITGNRISRRLGSWPDDTMQSEFLALSFYPPGGPTQITQNAIVESGTLILGFRFVGISVNGGQNANNGTIYDSNTITSNMGQPSGIGIFVNSAGGLDNVAVTNNTFQNLAIVTSGQPSPGVIYRNNIAINCLQTGIIALVQ